MFTLHKKSKKQNTHRGGLICKCRPLHLIFCSLASKLGGFPVLRWPPKRFPINDLYKGLGLGPTGSVSPQKPANLDPGVVNFRQCL